MKSFLDAFKGATKGVIALVVVIVLSVLAVYQGFDKLSDSVKAIEPLGKTSIWVWLSVLVPLLLTLAGAIVAQLRGKTLAASLILLVGVYFTKGFELFHAVLDFDSATKVTLIAVIGFFAFVYLALQALANLDEAKDLAAHLFTGVGLSALIAFTFFYFRDGSAAAVLTILPAVLALAAGSKVGAVFVLVAGVANIPFNVIEGLDASVGSAFIIPGQAVAFKDYEVLNWVFLAAGLYLLVTGVLSLVKHLKETE